MSALTIDELRALLGKPAVDPVYAAKQLHPLPSAPTVKRGEFILEHCKGKRVLEFGASGPLHDAIVKVANGCWGVDRAYGLGVNGFDLDDVTVGELPAWEFSAHVADDGTLYEVQQQHAYVLDESNPPEVIVCGEVIEHMSNPGWFLTRLKKQYGGITTIITVPNGFSDAGRKAMLGGTENCNKDHVAWYSPRTLTTLLERAGYSIREWYAYNGTAPTAEGWIVVAE